jgi:hypothetical protein
VYETGHYNLTEEQTTLLEHSGEGRTEPFKRFGIEQPANGENAPKG